MCASASRDERSRKELTAKTHLTAHAQTGLHHLAYRLVRQNVPDPAGEGIAEHVEDLEQHDLVADAVTRFKPAVRPGTAHLRHGERDRGRVGVDETVGEELVDRGERDGRDRTGRVARPHYGEERLQQGQGVDLASIWTARAQYKR